MNNKLKELLSRAIWVAYWRDRDIDTEDGTFASTDTDEMIHLESAIQDLFGGMEANDLVKTGCVVECIEAAIKNHESNELEQLRKESARLTEIAAQKASRADELFDALEKCVDELRHWQVEYDDYDSCEIIEKQERLLDKFKQEGNDERCNNAANN